MPIRRIAALAVLSFAAYGQALLDNTTIGKLVKAGIAEQTIVAMIDQQPGKYALSPDDIAALKKAGVSDRIMAAMAARNGDQATIPAVLALPDAAPIRMRLTRDLTFTNVKPGDTVDFEIMDDLRIDGVLVIARGARATATITQAEAKTRANRGGELGVSLEFVPLLNGDKVAVRAAKEGRASGPADAPQVAAGAMVRPSAPSTLFTYGKDEAFPEGTEIAIYSDGETRLNPARFLVDVAFTSNPQGALVNMYGTFIGRTPFTTRLAAGAYTAVFSVDGYANQSRSISVGPGHASAVHAVLESKR